MESASPVPPETVPVLSPKGASGYSLVRNTPDPRNLPLGRRSSQTNDVRHDLALRPEASERSPSLRLLPTTTFFMPGRENNSEPCIAAHHQVVRLCSALEREHLVIARMPASALKCLLRPNTPGSTIAGLIHRTTTGKMSAERPGYQTVMPLLEQRDTAFPTLDATARW